VTRRLRMGMVGGGGDAFIGGVHRRAALMDGEIELVAGALSSSEEKALASGRAWHLTDSRNYGSWERMLEGELSLPEDERIDFVSVVTPNYMHFPIAHAFVQAGFDVVCDKPMVLDGDQARQLTEAVERNGGVFCVTYNYTGYPMVKQARRMVRGGELGEIRKVLVEYNQGWLASALEEGGNKQAGWRTDPARSGVAGAVGDIGSHAENLIHTVTGLEIEAVCADLTTFVPGRRLDDDANILLRFEGGARGVMVASQVSAGEENALTLRVYGSEGGLQWRQEEPNHLIHRPTGAPARILSRGNEYLCEEARAATRLPSGHPEAFIEAFANVYAGAAAAIRGAPEDALDFPTVYDGARGVHFIERVVESAGSANKWTDAAWNGAVPLSGGAETTA
jgi:predicted dehydrogenase